MICGYARVSSTDQSLEVQIDQLKAAGCEKIFAEKKSGKTTDGRTELEAMLAYAREGDVIMCTRLDRLGRSLSDLITLILKLNKKGVGFKCLHQSGVDTTSAEGRLMINLLGSFAEFERELRAERQREGIEKAKAKGTYGVNKKKIKETLTRKLNRLHEENPTFHPKQLAAMAGCSPRTVYRHLPGIWSEVPEGLAVHHELVRQGVIKSRVDTSPAALEKKRA